MFFLIFVLAVLLGAYFIAVGHNDHSHTQGKPGTTLILPPRSSQGNPPSVPPSGPNPE